MESLIDPSAYIDTRHFDADFKIVLNRHIYYLETVKSTKEYLFDIGVSLLNEDILPDIQYNELKKLANNTFLMEYKCNQKVEVLHKLKESLNHINTVGAVEAFDFNKELERLESEMDTPDDSIILKNITNFEKKMYMESNRKDEYINKNYEPGGQDDDIQETYTTVNYNCPLTLKELVTAVKNICGHSYEENAILQFCSSKSNMNPRGNIKCPVAGCNKFVKASDLVRDTELMEDIKRSKKRKTAKKNIDMVSTQNL